MNMSNESPNFHQLIHELTENSKRPFAAKFFVINAILKFSEAVATAPPESLDEHSLISPVAWRDIACEIAGKINEYLRGNREPS
jgi:hypothetical protein